MASFESLGPHPVISTRRENSVDKSSRVRLRALALFLPLTAALYTGAEALNPKGTDQVINTTSAAFQVLPIAARHPAQPYLSGSLTIAALGALAVSYAAIAVLVRDRGWLLGHRRGAARGPGCLLRGDRQRPGRGLASRARYPTPPAQEREPS
jgi:hypothetical protein